MSQEWLQAWGPYEVPYRGAAGKALDGNLTTICPKCEQTRLRYYYHITNKKRRTGAMWVWCPVCRMVTHVSRQTLNVTIFQDPLANLSDDEFVELELSKEVPFMDRLDLLWEEGKIVPPALANTSAEQ